MAKRGPPPTPTKILKMRGSWRADGRGEEPEPSNEINMLVETESQQLLSIEERIKIEVVQHA